MDEEMKELARQTVARLECCIAGRCNECSYQKYFDDCGDRLNQDCLTLIKAAYKPEREEGNHG